MSKIILIISLLVSAIFADKLSTISTSGILFKDKLEVHSFEDPDIKGVVCYVTVPKRSLSFEDPTDSAISCRQVSPISGNIKSRSHIFKQSKNWFVKSMYVNRIYDKKHNVLIYVSYTNKLSGDNANNSISVVPIH